MATRASPPARPSRAPAATGDVLSADNIFITRVEPEREGIRLAVKDLFDTAGVRTTYGSAVFADHVPEATAEAVRLLEDAGYVSVGKANLHEFAYGVTSQNEHYGTVPNPHAPGRTAGGSSGGSAAALAAGLADAALGTDSGGSIRIPAACCGIVGFKPSFGLVSLDGVFPLAPSYDHAGPMARDVAGCAAMMRVLAGVGLDEVALADLRVGVAWCDEAEADVAASARAAAGAFGAAETVELPFGRETMPLFMREVADVHRELYAENAELYGANVRRKIERCLAVSEGEAATAADARAAYRDRALEALGNHDLLVTPTLGFGPPAADVDEIGARDSITRFTYPFDALGWPVLALPAGPFSVQLAGRPGADALVLAAGLALERTLKG